MRQELHIGIAGLGIVGSGVYKILTENLELLNKRSKRKLKLIAVSSRSKKDFIDDGIKFYADPLELAADEEIDVVVELIGGEGVAYELCKKTLSNKKHYVTANKAMIAVHGLELAKLAEDNNVSLCFESGVAGAIPVIKTLREGLAANNINKIYAILNGTSNYILTKMEEENIDFSHALKQAQELGYAESDPSFDIDGVDTAHKLAILSAIAKNSKIDFSSIYIEGIRNISIDDIKLADQLGYKIKLLGIFENSEAKKIKQYVYPALVKKTEKIAAVNDSFNAILTYSDNANLNFQVGRGAGSLPTASAVLADIIDLANYRYSNEFGCAVNDLINIQSAKIDERSGGYYLRFNVEKTFAKTSNFINEVFTREVIEKCIIEESSEDQLIYAVKTIPIGEVEMNSYVSALKMITQITNSNIIRIEDL